MTSEKSYWCPPETVYLGHLADRLNDFLGWYHSQKKHGDLPTAQMDADLHYLLDNLSVCPAHGYRECWCRFRLLALMQTPPGALRDRLYQSCLMEYQEYQQQT